MNVISLLTPKAQVAYLYDDFTVRQGLEKLRAHGYTAIPVLARDGSYVGTVSEGDFLWNLVDRQDNSLRSKEKQPLKSARQDAISTKALTRELWYIALISALKTELEQLCCLMNNY